MFTVRSFLCLCVLLVIVCQARLSAADDPVPNAEINSLADSTMTIAEVIEAVRREEARLASYSATTRQTLIFSPPSESAVEILAEHVVEGASFKFVGGEIIKLNAAETLRSHRQSIFDGTKTLAIEEDNSATEYAGRSAPPQLIPPHCWSLLGQPISMPLSVLLSGTDSIRSYLSAQGRGSGKRPPFEFSSIESTMIGREQLDSLDCEVVRIDRRTSENFSVVLRLWLAKNRNWQIARVQSDSGEKGKERFNSVTEVRNWRKIGPEIWIPRTVESFLVQPSGDRKPYQRLVIESAEVNPEITPTTFAIPSVPANLPKFSVNDQRLLIDSPHHPIPLTSSGTTTLGEILDQLAAEEQKYDPLEMDLIVRQDSLNPRMQSMAGEIFETREHLIRSGEMSYRDRIFSRLNPPGTFAEQRSQPDNAEQYRVPLEYSRQAYDGKVLRQYSKRRSMQEVEFQAPTAIIDRRTPKPKDRLGVAHGFLFREPIQQTSLSKFLRTSWYDESSLVRMEIAYDGDDLIDDLVCHKLVCRLSKGGRALPAKSFVLWLARDRNLIPLRREWHEQSVHAMLPAVLSYSEDLREIAAGVWFPFKSSQVTFQKDGDDALQTNRLMLQNRVDTIVKDVSIKGDIAPDCFSELLVPKGVTVEVIEPDRPRWQFTQAKEGRLEVDEQQRPAAVDR